MKNQAVSKKHKKLKIVIISLVAFILLFSVISAIVIKNVYDGFFPRAEKDKYNIIITYDDRTDYERKIVNFKSSKHQLTGYIYGSENDKGIVVIAHGLGGGAESYIEETVYFVDKGWRVFTYDCTGSYMSEGDGTIGLAQSVIDLDSALNYIEDDNSLSGLPIMLYGHSWGGYAVTAILNYEHDISAVVSVAGFNSPMEILVEWTKDMIGFLTYIEYPFLWGYQTFLFGKTAGLTGANGINKVKIPVMVAHGINDTVIYYDGASIISHKDQITNPNAIFKTYDEEYHDGHNNIFASTENVIYSRQIVKDYDKLYDECGGDIPDDVLDEFYSNVDREIVSALNIEFFDEVSIFFEESLIK